MTHCGPNPRIRKSLFFRWRRALCGTSRHLCLWLRGRGFRRGDRNSVEPPLIANHLKEEVEIYLQGSGRNVAGETQHTLLIERRHGGELWRE